MIKNNKKRSCPVLTFWGMLLFLVLMVGKNEVQASPYYNPYEYVQTYGTDSCRFAVVENEGRIYLSSYGKTGSKSYARYYTIGWKANLYLNGAWQESVYFSLNGGDYIQHLPAVTVDGVEYNLDYIRIDDLRNRFQNQSAINSGAGEIRLDSVMTVKNGGTDTPNGWIDDQGNRGGEVYEDYNGIANARGWSSQTMQDLHSNFNKTPTGMYFTVMVTGGTGISQTYGSGRYIYEARAVISADCATGYDFNTWSNGKTTRSFLYKVTGDASFSCTGKAKKYTVSYDANGGQGAPGNQTKTYGSVLKLSGTKPTRTGYLLDYWDSSSDGRTYQSGADYGTDADSKMSAHWSPITYYVGYQPNKPSKASSSVTGTTATSTHYYDTPKVVAANGYSLKGWSFTTWNAKADGSGSTTYSGGYVTNLTSTNKATVPLYAQWKPNVYMLILDEQYATVSGTSVVYEKYDHAWYKEKTAETATTKISVPSKIGMKFSGYYTKKNGAGTKYIDAGGNIVAKTNAFDTDVRVYAYWTPDVYKITLDNQDAVSSGTTQMYEKYGVGFFTTELCVSNFTNGKITIPKKNNYKFGGYYTEQNTWKTSNGEEIISADGRIKDVNTKFTADTTLYAKWIPVDYTINLENGNADLSVGSSVFYEKYGEYNYTTCNVADSSLGTETKTFSYTGEVQYFTAPYTGTYTLEVAGAQGASVGATGGNGGKSTGTIELQQGEVLAITVGGAGNNLTGGYNLGGDGTSGPIISYFGGGGATDIRRGGSSTSHRIIVAGGGGGTASYNHVGVYVNGADGGGEHAGRYSFVCVGRSCYVPYETSFLVNTRMVYKGKLQSCGANQTSSYTKYNNEGDGFSLSELAKISGLYLVGKGEGAPLGSGGGYYSGALIFGDCVVFGGGGGSGYIGGVKNGSMTTGTNSGNGWAKITYMEYTTVDSASTNIIVPKKTGYTFGGYWTEVNGKGTQCISESGTIITEPTYFDISNTTKKQTTIYAFWTSGEFRVTYDANGGIWPGHKETSISDSVRFREPYTIKNNMFNRDGYTFAGWSETKDGSAGVTAWVSGKTYLYSRPKNTTLYAQWEPGSVSYTVNYYLQNLDGTYSKSTPYVGSGTCDSIVTPGIKAFTGFEFDKTKSTSKPVGTKNNDGTISVLIKGDGSTVVNYYYSRKSYSVVLSGDKGFSKLYGAGTYKYGASVDIQADLNDKYEFVSWKYSNGNSFSSKAHTSFTMPANDVALVAQSNSKPDEIGPPIVKYTVHVKHYFKDSGTGEYVYKNTVSSSVEKNTLFIPQYRKNVTGYHAVKMIDEDTKANVEYGIVVTKDVTVDAYYDPDAFRICTKYFIETTNSAGIYGDSSTYALYDSVYDNVLFGQEYSVKEIDIPGYGLEKIETPNYGSNPFLVERNSLGDDAVKVYYKAKRNTITFHAEGGTIIDNNQGVSAAKRSVAYNSKQNNNVSSMKPSRAGYTFLGWYTEDGEQIYNAEGACTNDGTYWKGNKWISESDLLLYAQWKENSFNVTFDANGGFVNNDETTANCVMTYDKTYNNNVSYLNPYRTGYTFLGWYMEKSGGSQIYAVNGKCNNDGTYWKDGKWHYIGDAKLYAHWQANKYTVTYEANGGTGSMGTDTVTYDSDYTTRDNGFDKTGYIFKGWNEKADGTGEDWTSKIGNPFKWNYAENITLYAQWEGMKANICYHSEDEKHNITKEYQVGAGQTFEPASDWWKQQRFTTAYDPGNCIWSGWTTKKGSTDDMYSENAAVPDELIIDHADSTIDVYSIWDQPTISISATGNNLSFTCNNKTWYRDPVEIQFTGTDKRYNVIGFDFDLGNGNQTGNWRTTNNGHSLNYTLSTEQYFSEGLSSIIKKGEPFTVKAWSEASTATSGTPMGTSDALTTEFWIDFTPPELSYEVDSNHNIKATATDGECGVDTIELQSYRNGQWVSVNKATASSSQYSQFVNTFNLVNDDYKYRYRLVAKDHLGNSVTTEEFYVLPMTLTTWITKMNGDVAYNGQILNFMAGGDFNVTLNTKLTGYPEKVRYEFADELGQAMDIHEVAYDEDGNAVETKQLLIPWQIEHNKKFFVKVTAYRGNEAISTVEYVKITDIDFSKFRSNIIYQSGQHE